MYFLIVHCNSCRISGVSHQCFSVRLQVLLKMHVIKRAILMEAWWQGTRPNFCIHNKKQQKWCTYEYGSLKILGDSVNVVYRATKNNDLLIQTFRPLPWQRPIIGSHRAGIRTANLFSKCLSLNLSASWRRCDDQNCQNGNRISMFIVLDEQSQQPGNLSFIRPTFGCV